MIENNKSLQIRKGNFFKKIIQYIKSLFKSNEQKIEEIDEKAASNKKESFANEIKFQREDPMLLEFQRKFENGEIDLEDISHEKIQELNLLYDRQLVELENELAVKRTELNAMKKKLNNFLINK